MPYKNKNVVRALAWTQLVFSALLAATVIWGYVSSRAALGQFAESVATAIVSTANVIGQVAETVQAKQSMIDNTMGMLVSSRKLITELQTSAQNQSALAPKYAEGFRGASGILGTAGNVFSVLGDSLMFSAPTGIQMEGIRPVVLMTKPLEVTGQKIKENAIHLKSLGDGLLGVSSSLAADGQNVSAAFIDTSGHAIKLLDDTEKTLAVLQGQELPRAVTQLKTASDNLRTVGSQVDLAGNIGLVLLFAGLLLAGWCFLNSLSVLYLLKIHSTGSTRDQISCSCSKNISEA